MNNDIHCASERVALLNEMIHIFKERKAPSPVEVSEGDASLSFEYAYCQQFFAGRRWFEIGYDELRYSYPSGASAMVTFLSDVGFIYYLPAFMSCVLDDFHASETLLESLLFKFSPGSSINSEAQFFLKYSNLLVNERKCLLRFLSFLSCCHADDLPVEIYGDAAPEKILAKFLVV